MTVLPDMTHAEHDNIQNVRKRQLDWHAHRWITGTIYGEVFVLYSI